MGNVIVRTSVFAALVLVACKGRGPSPTPQPPPKQQTSTVKVGEPVVRGTLKHANVETMYAVAVAAGSDLAALEKLARARAPGFEVKRGTVADVFNDAQLKVSMEGLADTDRDGVKTSPAVILLHGTGTDAMKLARTLAAAARDVADAAHGWVLDPDAIRILSAEAFHDHVPGDHPDVRKLIMVHSVVGSDTPPFLDTAGMHRYGFPELYLAEASSGEIRQAMQLINGAAQTLLDEGDVDERGEIAIDFHKLGWFSDIIADGTGKAVWRTRWAREPGDGNDAELMVELVPPAGEGAEGVSKLVATCFGREPDKITMLKDDDPELLAAAKHARADLEQLRPELAGGVPVNELLSVKAKFTDDNGVVEWMWVDVVSFKGDTFAGTLANEPDLIKSLRDGQKVTAKLADVADYILEKRNGERTAGGYSIQVLKKRGLVPDDESD